MSYRPLLLVAGMLLLTACSPLVGTIIATVPSPDGTAVATLTRDGDTYRVYLTGKTPQLEPWEMLRTVQHATPHIRWKDDRLVMLDSCGGTFNYPHSNSTHYPHPDAAHGIGVGISTIGCR